jgi:putative ABC transport system substrate-binding protein
VGTSLTRGILRHYRPSCTSRHTFLASRRVIRRHLNLVRPCRLFHLSDLAKRLGLLRDVKPGIATVGALLNPDSVTAPTQRNDIEEAARTIGLKVRFLEAKNNSELDAAFKFIVENRIPALLVPADAFFAAARDRLAGLTALNHVPAIYSLRESVVSGGLMSYGNDLPDTYRLVGNYAARIVKGAKPADLPVLQPTKFEFVLNRKAANALGLTIPPGVLSIVDEVIE